MSSVAGGTYLLALRGRLQLQGGQLRLGELATQHGRGQLEEARLGLTQIDRIGE